MRICLYKFLRAIHCLPADGQHSPKRVAELMCKDNLKHILHTVCVFVGIIEITIIMHRVDNIKKNEIFHIYVIYDLI